MRPFVVVFIAGLVCGGTGAAIVVSVFSGVRQSRSITALDNRYEQQQRSGDIAIRGIEAELDRARGDLERERSLNSRARELINGASATVGRNVTNLQGAIDLIREIRGQLKVLEDFYADGLPAAALLSEGIAITAGGGQNREPNLA
jgi:hypothetical protein